MKKGAKVKIFALITVLLLMVIGVLLVLFLGNDDTDLPKEEVFFKGDSTKINKTDEQKKTFVIGSSRIPLDYKPYFHETEVGYAITNLVYEPLVNVSADGKTTPVLAETVTFSADGLTASVTLKETVFSDGSKLTADDVVKSYLTFFAPDSSYYDIDKGAVIKGYYDYMTGASTSISGVRAISNSVVEISFADISAKNIYALDVPVVKSEKNSSYAIGSGEYIIDEIVPGISAKLTKNTKSTSEKFTYEQFIFKSVSADELEQAINSFDMDLFFTNTESMLDIIKKAGYHDVYRMRDSNYSYIGFNLQFDSVASNANVRKAIAYSINRSEIGSTYYQDYLTSMGIVSTSKSSNSFEKTYILDLEKAEECLENALNEISTSAAQQVDIIDGTKLTVNYLCQNDSYSNGFYLNMQEALLSAKINLTQTGVYETEYVQTLAAMEGFDVYHKLNYENNPIEVIESIVVQSDSINTEYENVLKDQYVKDYTKVLDEVENFTVSQCLLIPTFADDYYVAMSSDANRDNILDLIRN